MKDHRILSRLVPIALCAGLASSAARADSIPKASYKLSLPPYSLEMADYPFPSGLRIIFQEDHNQPIVAITTVIDHGSSDDFEGREGMAHVVEHLNFRTRHGDLPKLMDVIKQLGGSFNAFTADDVTAYMTIAPRDALEPLLRIEALRLVDPLEGVTQHALDLEREIARNELRQNYENAIGDALARLHVMLFPKGHPYATLGIGDHAALDRITLDDVLKFTKMYYKPSEATIVVVGDFDLKQSSEFIQKVFGDHPELLYAPGVDPRTTELELVEPKPRITGPAPEPPEPVDKGPVHVSGMVDKTTVVVGWTMPAGYRPNENSMSIAVSLVQNAIIQNLNPDFDPFKSNEDISWVGCNFQPQRLASIAACFVEPRAGMSPEKTITRIGDALVSAWDPSTITSELLRNYVNFYFSNAKSLQMANVLRSVDEVASLFGGRATNMALHAHFLSSPTYFSDTFSQIQQEDLNEAKKLAQQYLNRDRMVAVIVDPLSPEEKARRDAASTTGDENTQATWHGSQAKDEFEFSFDINAITPEAIKRVFIAPDRSKMHEFKLDNGLDVVVMPYGEAPIVRAGLYVHGGSLTSQPTGLDQFAESLTDRGSHDPAEQLGQVAGASSDGSLAASSNNDTLGTVVFAEGASGNLPALLRTLRQDVEKFDWRMADKHLVLKDAEDELVSSGKEPATWAGRMRDELVFGKDHPLGQWANRAHIEAAKKWDLSMVQNWMYSKYRPDNAHLVVVGRIDDLDAATNAIHRMFDGWKVHSGAPPAPERTLPPLEDPPDRQVLIFDKGGATQSEILMACQLAPVDADHYAQMAVMGDVISERAWRELREQRGVTYGAYAFTRRFPGDVAVLMGYTLNQNSAVGLGVKTMLDLVQETAQGNVDPKVLAAQKWQRARTYVLQQQSGRQMIDRLLSQHESGLGFDFFDEYAEALAAVQAADFAPLLKPCLGHEVVTVVGPKEIATEQLDELGIQYRVVDWKKLYEAELTPKELKAYRKAEAKKKEETKKDE